MDLCRKLPIFISDSEENFKLLIDLLYCAFWDNKAKINEVLPNKPFSFINDLRKYYRHDLEHDDKKDVNKKYNNVKNFFKEACGKSYPINSKDWQKVQNYIYELIIEILNKTETKIKNI